MCARYTREHLVEQRGIACALVAALVVSVGSGCAHTMIVETEPMGAVVTINGEPQGDSPAVTTQFTSTGGRLYVTAEADGYEKASLVVTQSEWFLWPAIVAVTPLFGVPFVVIPILGPIITVGWAVLTSPTLVSLLFLQKYPERVKLKMKAKVPNDPFVPTDTWLIPDDMDPNPPPLPDAAPPAPEDPSKPPEQPPQPEGGNPVP
jgi:hypothetical protein